MTEHTRESLGLPWRKDLDHREPMSWISDSRKEPVATAWIPAFRREAGLISKADCLAAFIVTACNSHHDLVEALSVIANSNQRPGHVAYVSKAEVCEIARTALAKVKGGAS